MSIKKTMSELERLTPGEFKERQKLPIVIILDEVRSMHNVGSVFRSADAFLIEGICLCGFTPQPPHRDIQKTALGATETVAWTHYPSTLDAVQQYKSKGYTLIAVEQVHNSIPLHQFSLDPTKRYALVFGNEVNGVDEVLLTHCDSALEIPQLGTKHSLNISVSAGVVLWEMVKQTLLF
jgi:23S rRNA (guanosine2251-2'-O)-methyltransferase